MNKHRRFLVGADIHGDQQEASAVKAFFKFAEIWKPEIRICAGDLWDFRPLRNGASEDEKRESMREDLKAGKDWFNQFKPTHFLRGNHDQRLWELAIAGRGVVSDFAQEGVEEIEAMVAHHKCKMLPYHKRDGVLKLGHLKVLHGFASGIYAARQHALVYGSCLFGHVHAIDEHAIPGLERRVARCIGALCKLSMPYNERHMNTLKQAHGFAFGVLSENTGNYHVWQAEEIDGKWIIPSDFIEL